MSSAIFAYWSGSLEKAIQNICAKYLDRVDEFEYQQKVLHGVIDANKHNPDVQIKAVNALHSITVNMTRLYQSLPVSTFYIPSPGDINNGNANVNQQQKLELDWKDDPTFAGMPGHNLDENYNLRPKSNYHDHDPDFGDQP